MPAYYSLLDDFHHNDIPAITTDVKTELHQPAGRSKIDD